MAPRRKHSKRSPEQKFSETFLAFAAPLIESADDGITKEQFEDCLKLAFIAWNAVVLDEVAGNMANQNHVRGIIADEPGGAAMMEMLFSRKKRLFGKHQWTVGDYAVVLIDQEWRVRVEARDPRRIF